MPTSWSELPIHFLDFEGSLASGIIEFGIVTIQGNRIVNTAGRLCRPTGRIRAEDQAVHGIDAREAERCAPFTDEFERFVSLRATGPLAAHFASVENGLLKSVWPYPRLSPDFSRPAGEVLDWGPWVDTGRLYPQLYPRLGSAKLETLVAAFGLQAELDAHAERHCPAERRHYHAALYDALAGALLLGRLAEEPTLGGRSPAWLFGMSTLDPDRRATFDQGELF